MEETTYKLTSSRLYNLLEQSLTLNALEAGGVDNWEWYDETDFPTEDEVYQLLQTYEEV